MKKKRYANIDTNNFIFFPIFWEVYVFPLQFFSFFSQYFVGQFFGGCKSPLLNFFGGFLIFWGEQVSFPNFFFFNFLGGISLPSQFFVFQYFEVVSLFFFFNIFGGCKSSPSIFFLEGGS